jgi:hypothetical protein
MVVEVARELAKEQERPAGFRSLNLEGQTFCPQPALSWDEVAKKWPKGRFPSFFSIDKNA